MKYGLDDRLPALPTLLYTLMWWAVGLPCVLMMGLVVTRLHFTDVGQQIFYLQKLFGVVGLAMLAQTVWGHKLPLINGPAAILLVGLAASGASGYGAMYTAVMVGGLAMALLSWLGLASRLRVLFTARVVAVVLMLIALTITPTILKLTLTEPGRLTFQLFFALGLTALLVLMNTHLPGIWKSMAILLGLVGGSLAYFAVAGRAAPPEPTLAAHLWLVRPEFEAGAILSFMICFMALTINEMGSIESIGRLVGADAMDGRLKRGLTLEGLANTAAGALGVMGPVDYTLSAGLISGAGCAARRPLALAGLGLFICAFFPAAISLAATIPGPVMGALMLYLMSSQLSSGLSLVVAAQGVKSFNSGLTVGLPLMVGLLIAFAPPEAFSGVPAILRPVVGNGFVMGAIVVAALEHIIFRRSWRKDGAGTV